MAVSSNVCSHVIKHVKLLLFSSSDLFNHPVFHPVPILSSCLTVRVTSQIPEPPKGHIKFFHHMFFLLLFFPSTPVLQNFHSLATYLSQCSSTAFLDIVSDFHLLLFLVTNEVMPLRVRRLIKDSCPSSKRFPPGSNLCGRTC